MRKYLLYIVTLFTFLFVGILSVKAAPTITPDKTSINVGGTVTLTVSGVEGDCIVKYNGDFFELTDTGTGIKDSENHLNASGNFVMRAKSGLSLTEASLQTISIVKDDVGYPVLNSTTVTIKANKTATTTTVPTTTAATTKSNNAKLKTLSLKANDGSVITLSPEFSGSVYDYTATVAGTVETVSLDATLEDTKANMIVSSNVSKALVAGETSKIVVTVTAEDGTTKLAYNVSLKKEALGSDASLKSLKIKEVEGFTFKSDTYKYKIKVANSVTKLTITSVANDENASVAVSGNKDLKDGSKVKILVTAQDGTKKEYTLTISKSTTTTTTKAKTSSFSSKEKNPLIIMGLSLVAFSLIGGIVYTIKK